jgi:hypothetical protein
MMSNGFIYIRNAEDDAYVNHGDNFKGMEQAASGAVILYFDSPISATTETGGSYDKITLAVTANSEKQAMIDINGALFGGKAGSTTVIADDYGNASCSDLISTTAGVTSIEKALAGTTSNVITLTDDRTLTSGESGSFVVLNHATKIITLPTAAAGLNYKIMFLQDTDAACTIVAGSGDCFFGNIKVTSATEDQTEIQDINHATAIATVANYDNLDFDHDEAALGGKAGDIVHLMAVDSTAWHVEAVLTTDHANPASIAVINAG